MILDKKPRNLFDKALQNLTIIISACPSVTKNRIMILRGVKIVPPLLVTEGHEFNLAK